MSKLILFFSFSAFVVEANAISTNWTRPMQKLYAERRFIELEQVLIAKNQVQLAKNIRLQSADLYGCKWLHEGHGLESSFESCLRFLSRENEIHLYSPKRKETVTDMNLICQRFSEKKAFVEKMLAREGPNIKGAEWKLCSEALWRQVFLTMHASFRAHPVRSLAYLRRAEVKLLPDNLWQKKIKGVIVKNQ